MFLLAKSCGEPPINYWDVHPIYYGHNRNMTQLYVYCVHIGFSNHLQFLGCTTKLLIDELIYQKAYKFPFYAA
jgi:hypothetical protein